MQLPLYQKLTSWERNQSRGKPHWIFRMSWDRILRRLDELQVLLPLPTYGAASPYTLFVDSSLAGGLMPCADVECRARRVHYTARLIALYADEAIFPARFSEYERSNGGEHVREQVYGDLLNLMIIRPLVERGLIKFLPDRFTACRYHHDLLESEMRDFYAKSDQTVARTAEEISPLIDIELIPSKDRSAIMISAPREILEYGSVVYTIRSNRSRWAETASQDSLGDQDKSDILREFILSESLDDVQHFLTCRALFGGGYLTCRSIDVRLLAGLSTAVPVATCDTGIAGILGSLPLFGRLDLPSILQVREAAPEEFRLCRSAIQKLVNQGGSGMSNSDIRNEIQDAIDRLSVKVGAERQERRMRSTEDILTTAGVLTASILTGVVSPEAGAVMAAFGGVKGVSSLIKGLARVRQVAPAVRSDSFYFLWKAAQLSNCMNKRA
jgi:hypothetical protein